ACAVVAVPDGLRGQRPVAYVVPDTATQSIPATDEILGQVHRALGRWVGLKEVRFVQHLPTTVSGKITRRHLLAL
ncbi:MAG: acetyl-CoA synthetase, partial [Acetobacter sp.]|nr:acetyl-CoA synthetase [Acetobacter sp.]